MTDSLVIFGLWVLAVAAYVALGAVVILRIAF